MKIQDACPTCGALCEVDLGNEEGKYVAIEHVVSATPADPYAEYYRGLREAFDMANMIAAGGYRGMEDLTLKEVIRTLANLANGESRATPADHSKLQVWYGSMPESNGKTNFTAILHRGDLSKGFTIDRSEYPDRVRYEADRVRWLIGEINKEPWILDYDADKHSGYVKPADHSPDMGDAYAGAREDLAIWKKRALEAEELNRKFMREINGPTFMGEPAHHIVDANKKVDAPTLNKLVWSDMSTASPVEKARRVLDHLSKQDSVYFFEDGFPRSVMMSDVRACIAVLNHLPPQPEAQSVRDAWISVDDQLPENDSVALVSGWEYGKTDGKRFTLIARCINEIFHNEETGDTLYAPTHWQPLPAPPQKPVSDEVKP